MLQAGLEVVDHDRCATAPLYRCTAVLLYCHNAPLLTARP